MAIRCFLVHYRSYWREWRPLVTPWASCIKEGIEPWKSQKWLFPSHAQVGVTLLSLLFSYSVSAFILVIIIIIIIAMNMYLQMVYDSSGYKSKSRPDYSKTSPFANSLSLSLLSSLSLFCNGHCMCSQLSNTYNVASRARCIISVHGYLTLIISTALLVSFACCSLLFLFCNGHCMCSRLSNPYNVANRALSL